MKGLTEEIIDKIIYRRHEIFRKACDCSGIIWNSDCLKWNFSVSDVVYLIATQEFAEY